MARAMGPLVSARFVERHVSCPWDWLLETPKMTAPLISVVIATHNRESLLPGAVESFLAQTVQDFEVLIVDDGSTDGTPGGLQDLERMDSRIRAFRTPGNVGPGAARNLAFAHARGRYVAVQDDDDFSYPDRLERQVLAFEQDPALGLVFSAVRWINRSQEVLQDFPLIVCGGQFPVEPADVFHLLYLESNKVPNTTIMVRREVLDRWVYPASPWIGEDWFWCMQMAASGVRMRAIPEPLVRQLRDRDAPGLMHNRVQSGVAQRLVLGMVRDWLQANGDTRFDRLHRMALANQYAREALDHPYGEGLQLCLRSFLLAPLGSGARRSVGWMAKKAWSRGRMALAAIL